MITVSLRLEISIGALSAPGRLTLPLGGIPGVDATTPRGSAEARDVRREGPAFSAPGAFTQSRQLAPRHFGDRATKNDPRPGGPFLLTSLDCARPYPNLLQGSDD